MNNINPNTIILPNSIYPQLNFALDLKLSIDISTVHITRGNWAEEVIEERDRSHNRLNKIKLKKKKITVLCILTKASNYPTYKIHKHQALLHTVEFNKYEPWKENFYLQTSSQMIELATV